MKDLDQKIKANNRALQQHRSTDIFQRNKKLFVFLVIVLIGFWLFSVAYAYYWLPRLPEMVGL